MFGLFKKKKEEETPAADFNYDLILIDLHSHVLPGLDDGAQNIEESLELIGKMMELGIRKVIATPHVMIDYYRNDADTIYPALELLRARLKEENIDMELEAAAEHYYDETFEKRIEEGRALTMPGNFVLFELSFVAKPLNVIAIIQKMKEKGYKPILAHPERYGYYTIEDLQSIRDWGCALQLNTISLTGYYGSSIREKAEALIDNEMIDFISSDMHHLRHAEALKNALHEPYLKKLIDSGKLRNWELL